MEPMTVELSCDVCVNECRVYDAAPAQAELLIEVWTRNHAHTPEERDAHNRDLHSYHGGGD